MNAVIWILLGFMFVSGVLAGMLAVLVTGIRSDDRRRDIHRAPCTHGQGASRRLLVNIRGSRANSSDSEDN